MGVLLLIRSDELCLGWRAALIAERQMPRCMWASPPLSHKCNTCRHTHIHNPHEPILTLLLFRCSVCAAALITFQFNSLTNTCWHTESLRRSFVFLLSVLLPPLSSSLRCPTSVFPNCVFHQRITAGKHHAVLNESVTAECPKTSPQCCAAYCFSYCILLQGSGW